MTLIAHCCSPACASIVQARANELLAVEHAAGRPDWPEFFEVLRFKQPFRVCAICDGDTGPRALATRFPREAPGAVAYVCEGLCAAAMSLHMFELAMGGYRCLECGRACDRENHGLRQRGILVARACSSACKEQVVRKWEPTWRILAARTEPLSIDAWLRYPEIAFSRNLAVVAPAHKVHAIATAFVDEVLARKLGIVPDTYDDDTVDDDGVVIASAVVETSAGGYLLVRLPLRLGEWAMETVRAVREGELSYPFVFSLAMDGGRYEVWMEELNVLAQPGDDINMN